MKAMMILLQESCSNLIQAMDNFAKIGTEFELRQLLGKAVFNKV